MGDRPRRLLRPPQGRAARARAQRPRRVDHRHAARAVADALGHRRGRLGRQARAVEVQPARGLDRARRVGLHRRSRPALATRCTTTATPRSAACTARRPGAAARAAGRGARRPNAACTSDAPRAPRVRSGPRHARGGRRARAPGAAVLGRQGLDRAAASGREGVPPRAASRSRCCTSTPATTSPRCIEFRDRRVAELGERLVVASVQDSIDAGRVVEERGPRASRNRLQTDDAARRDRGAPLRRLLRRRPPRRGARAGQGARDLAARRLRRLGPAAPAPGAVGPLQHARPPGRAPARVPAVELDRARRLAVHRPGAARGAVDLPRARAARCSSATGCCSRRPSSSSATTARTCSRSGCATARSGT